MAKRKSSKPDQTRKTPRAPRKGTGKDKLVDKLLSVEDLKHVAGGVGTHRCGACVNCQ